MKRIIKWVSRLSVKKKLIFYGYLIVTPVLIAVCIILGLQNFNREAVKKQQTESESATALSDSIFVLQSDIENFSTYLCINDQVRELLTATDPDEKNKNSKLWVDEAPMKIVLDILALKGQIQTLAIYPENGIRPYLRCMDGSSYVSDVDSVHSSDIYQKTITSENGMIWQIIPKGSGETFYHNKTAKIGLYRKIYDYVHKKVIGYIVLGANQNQFTNLCKNTLKEDGECALVLNQNGEELCRAGNLNSEVEKYLLSGDFLKEHSLNSDEYFSVGEYDIACTRKTSNSVIICRVVPKITIREQIAKAAYIPLILLVSILLALLPVLLIISNLVTEPLARVSEAIRKFSKGDFEQQVKVTTDDEIGEVAKCFNKMVLDIKNLINENYVITLKERESELSALQAQINPHFLYNTLDSLYWQATSDGNEEIAESVLALSELFKLVLSHGSREVPVESEIELVSRYLQIQKMRFSKRLNYEINAAPEILKHSIPKLVLQPFVENAIVHGFENTNTPCMLTVSGWKEDNSLHFEITDTGVGMSREQIDAIWEDEPVQYAKQRIGRYAIKNIRERLRLKYNDDFELKIESRIGEGTKVILILPIVDELVLLN